jgi:hypothetical protein
MSVRVGGYCMSMRNQQACIVARMRATGTFQHACWAQTRPPALAYMPLSSAVNLHLALASISIDLACAASACERSRLLAGAFSRLRGHGGSNPPTHPPWWIWSGLIDTLDRFGGE